MSSTRTDYGPSSSSSHNSILEVRHPPRLHPPQANLALLRLAQESDTHSPWKARILRALAIDAAAQAIVASFLQSECRQQEEWVSRQHFNSLTRLRTGLDAWFEALLQADNTQGGLLRLHLDQRQPVIDFLSLDLLRRALASNGNSNSNSNSIVPSTDAASLNVFNRPGSAAKHARKSNKARIQSLQNLPLFYTDKAAALLRRGDRPRNKGKDNHRDKDPRQRTNPPNRTHQQRQRQRRTLKKDPLKHPLSFPNSNLKIRKPLLRRPLRREIDHFCHRLRQTLEKKIRRECMVYRATLTRSLELHSSLNLDLRSLRTTPGSSQETLSLGRGLGLSKSQRSSWISPETKREADRRAALAALESNDPANVATTNFSRKISPRSSPLATAPAAAAVPPPRPPLPRRRELQMYLDKPLPPLPPEAEAEAGGGHPLRSTAASDSSRPPPTLRRSHGVHVAPPPSASHSHAHSHSRAHASSSQTRTQTRPPLPHRVHDMDVDMQDPSPPPPPPPQQPQTITPIPIEWWWEREQSENTEEEVGLGLRRRRRRGRR